MPFGNRLKEARLRLKMTQEQLAKEVGVTKGAIGNYESEVSSPKEDILIRLMEVLGVDANYLFQDLVTFPTFVSATIPNAKDFSLSDEEKLLVMAYRNATPGAQEIAMEVLANHPANKQDAHHA